MITPCDTSIRPRILQRWIEATIYNDDSSKSESCVTEHNTILHNLGYKGMNLRSSYKSMITSTIPTMWIYELKSNMEGTQQNVSEWLMLTSEENEFTNMSRES